jgi:AcrR family transcriptional regulator
MAKEPAEALTDDDSRDTADGDARAAERRHVLCEAARKVFTDRGWARARTRDIADLAGVTETGLYRYFSSKHELFEASILEPLEELVAKMKDLAPQFQTVSLRGRVSLSQQVHVEMHKAIAEIAPLLCLALFSDVEAGRRFYQERLMPHLTEIAEELGRTLQPKEQRAMSSQQMLLAILGMHLTVATQATLSGEDVRPEVVAKVFTKVLAFGIPMKR